MLGARSCGVIRLYVFARHGESTANVRQRIDSDPCRDVELSEYGRRQALRLAAQLRHLPIERAVCSRFTRTRQTAEIALREHTAVALEVEAGFDEVDAGTFDDVPVADYWHWRALHSELTRFPGGESIRDACHRYAGGLEKLLRSPVAVTLVVCHEHMLRLLLLTTAASARERIESVAHADPYLFDADAIRTAHDRLLETPDGRLAVA